MTRIMPGVLAILIGLVLAGVLFVPFIAASYRLRGRVTLGRTLQWIALLVAFLALWAYTIFPAPLPTDDYRCTTPNFDILYDLRDIIAIQQAGESLIANAALQVVLLNVLFFVPIGFLLRTLFGWGIVRGGLAGFALSLAVETTQLTGLWGIYPCSYRLFSVDDLLHNTVGTVLGSLLALLFVRRGSVTAAAAPAERPAPRLTAGRRLLGMTADLVLFFSVSAMVGMIISILGLVAGRSETDPLEELAGLLVALVVYLAPILVTGSSWGEMAVMIRVTGGWRPVLLSRLVRAAVGVGGVYAMAEFVPVVGAFLALGVVVATLVLVVARADRRGLGAILAGTAITIATPVRGDETTPRGDEPTSGSGELSRPPAPGPL